MNELQCSRRWEEKGSRAASHLFFHNTLQWAVFIEHKITSLSGCTRFCQYISPPWSFYRSLIGFKAPQLLSHIYCISAQWICGFDGVIYPKPNVSYGPLKSPCGACLPSSSPYHLFQTSHSWDLSMMALMHWFISGPQTFYSQCSKVHKLSHELVTPVLIQKWSFNLLVFGRVVANGFKFGFRFLPSAFQRSSPSGFEKSGHFRDHSVCLPSSFLLLLFHYGLFFWAIFIFTTSGAVVMTKV